MLAQVPCPAVVAGTRGRYESVAIQIPVAAQGRLWLRLSAALYNEDAEYEALREVVLACCVG